LKKVIKVNNFIAKLVSKFQNVESKKDRKNKEVPHCLTESNIKVMKDEFSPRDLKYQEVKNFFVDELRGASLK